MRMIAAALLWIALCAVPAAATADDGIKLHTVKEGDSLPILAAEYYGDRNHMLFIMVANKLVSPRPLKKGERIKVPVSLSATVAKGDTWDDLAQTYLGDRRRGKYLAEFNGANPERQPAAGVIITVPFTVKHTASGDEAIAQIAQAYFGNSQNADLLRGYNFLEKDRLTKGESVIIPIHHIKVRDAMQLTAGSAAQREEAAQRAEQYQEQMQEAARVLPRAQAAWRRGDYATVKRELLDIDLDYLDADRAVTVGRLLGAAYVALDDEVWAVKTFRRVLARAPDTQLSPYRYSPRIRAVWAKAQQPAEGE